MPVRFLSDAELARLSSWPDEIAEHDLVAFFTFTSDDAAWLSGTVRVENRLGAAVQLCTLPWLGWIPDDLTGCPSAAVSRLGSQLGLALDDLLELLASYGGWEGRTRRDHRALVLTRLGWRGCGSGERKQLDAFLLALALDTTRQGCCCSSPATGYGTNGSCARRWTRCLVGLRLPATGRGRRHMTCWPRCWSRHAGPGLSALPTGRRRMLAKIGRRSTNQALQRSSTTRWQS